MTNILKRFITQEEKKIISKRILCFQYSHKLYWAKKMVDGTIEFWAHSAVDQESWYLGNYRNNVIIECEGFYHHALPWDVQKGANRIFSEISLWGD